MLSMTATIYRKTYSALNMTKATLPYPDAAPQVTPPFIVIASKLYHRWYAGEQE
jgi:hypothetical protein